MEAERVRVALETADLLKPAGKPARIPRIGIVGFGYMGREYWKTLQTLPGVTLAGIVAKDDTRVVELQERYAGMPVFSSLDSLWLNTRPTHLIIAVPELAMPGVLLEAIQYPYEILVEKPFTLSVQSGLDLLDSVGTARSRICVALNRRFYRGTKIVKERTAASKGQRFFVARDQHSVREALDAGQPEAVAAKWPVANAIHTVDLLLFTAASPVVKVESSRRRFGIGHVVNATITFESGDIASYQSVWEVPGNWAFSCHTPEEYLVLEPLESTKRWNSLSKSLELVLDESQNSDLKAGIAEMVGAFSSPLGLSRLGLPSISETLESMSMVEEIFDDASDC